MEDRYLGFGDLLDHLRRNGFKIGIDSHLRLQKVLRKVSGNCSPEDLKTLLCPIFSTNKRQQEFFYSAFDSYFGLADQSISPTKIITTLPKATSRREREPVWARRWPYILIAFLITVIIAALLYHQKQQTQIGSQQPIQAAVTIRASTVIKNEPVPELIYAIRGVAILAPVLFLVLYEFYLHNRRTLLLKRLRSTNQPHTFPLHPNVALPPLFGSTQFHDSARLLRRRQVAEFSRLDIDATVQATTKSLGYPQFRYKPASRIPEYLILVERKTYSDHVAAFFDALTKEIEDDGLVITRYYYDGDARVCFRPSGEQNVGEQGVPVGIILSEHEDCRLLVFGSGEGLFDPVLGTLQDWTSIFSKWNERALITPIPTDEWAYRERILSQQFFIVPATVDGLQSLAEHYEGTNILSPSSWIPKEVVRIPEDFDSPTILTSLKAYLGNEVFQWLCACAVYPRLEWTLTIYTRSLPCLEPAPSDEIHLLRLMRLPWFRNGSIPQTLRQQLISQLAPEVYSQVRRAIVDILGESEQLYTVRADTTRPFNVAIPHAKRIFSEDILRKLLRIRLKARVLRDYIFVHFLESRPNTVLDLILPRSLGKLFYPRGNTALRARIGARVLLTLFAAFVIWMIAPVIARAIKSEPALIAADSRPSSVSMPPPPGSILPSPKAEISPGPSSSGPQFSPTAPTSTGPSPLSQFTPSPSGSISDVPGTAVNSPTAIAILDVVPTPTLAPTAPPTAQCPEVKVVCSIYAQVQARMSAVTYSATATTSGGKLLQEAKYQWSLLYDGLPATPAQGRIISGQGNSKVELEWTIKPHTTPVLTTKVLVTGYNATCFTESSCTVPVQERGEPSQPSGDCECASCQGIVCCPNRGFCISCGLCGFVCCSGDP